MYNFTAISKGVIEIGKSVLIASYATILDFDYAIDDVIDNNGSYVNTELNCKPVIMKNNDWIGEKVIILRELPKENIQWSELEAL